MEKAEDKDRYLLDEGVETARVAIVNNDTKTPKETELNKAQIKQFADSMLELASVSRIITRKGISLESYLAARNDGGKFPLGMAIIDDAPKFAYTKEEFAILDPDSAKAANGKATNGAAPANGSDLFASGSEEEVEQDVAAVPEEVKVKVETYEFPESREIETIVRAIEKMGFDVRLYEVDHLDRGQITDDQAPYRVYGKDNVMHAAFSLAEVLQNLMEIGGKGISVQRYKGLGEMNAEQLWETTMDPRRRRLLRISMDDAVEAEQIFSTLMGDEVVPRRAFIQRHAPEVRNLDV
jgi:DNA gyrase subunit B